jgi:hypothetical protein
MKATLPVYSNSQVNIPLTREQMELNAVLAKFASKQKIEHQELFTLGKALANEKLHNIKQPYAEILFGVLRDSSRDDYISIRTTALSILAKSEVCEGVVFPEDIVLIISDNLTRNSRTVANALKNIARTQELATPVKDKLLSYLKPDNACKVSA